MGREGYYDEYKQYNVPPALEKQWRTERIETLISQLAPDDRGTVIALSIWNAKEALPRLIANGSSSLAGRTGGNGDAWPSTRGSNSHHAHPYPCLPR